MSSESQPVKEMNLSKRELLIKIAVYMAEHGVLDISYNEIKYIINSQDFKVREEPKTLELSPKKSDMFASESSSSDDPMKDLIDKDYENMSNRELNMITDQK